MISKAISRFIRISPRKTRLVADMIRGKPIDEAQAILANLEKRARFYVKEVLNSAIANATSINPDVSAGSLYVSKITVDSGPMFKRYRAGSMGRAMMIKHKTSHIFVELDVKKEKSSAVSHQPSAKGTKKTTTAEKKQSAKASDKNKVKKVAAAKKGK
jgi:large subunit ribosomal protein L22